MHQPAEFIQPPPPSALVKGSENRKAAEAPAKRGSSAAAAAIPAAPARRHAAPRAMRSALPDLSLRKRLLTQQLSILDARERRLRGIVGRKAAAHERRRAAGRAPCLPNPPPLPPPPSTPAPSPACFPAPRNARAVAAQRRAARREAGPPRPAGLLSLAPQPIQPGGAADRIRKRDALRRTEMRCAARRSALARRARRPPRPSTTAATVPQPLFVRRYERGELPCRLEHRAAGFALSWARPPGELELARHLPIFLEGLRCTRDPCRFLARQGAAELLEAARSAPGRLAPLVGLLVRPLREAVATGDEDVLAAVLRVLRRLVESDEGVGRALVPHYRQLMHGFKAYYCGGRSSGGNGEGARRRGAVDLEALTAQTLPLLERTGGPGAFAALKWIIPAYESSC